MQITCHMVMRIRIGNGILDSNFAGGSNCVVVLATLISDVIAKFVI